MLHSNEYAEKGDAAIKVLESMSSPITDRDLWLLHPNFTNLMEYADSIYCVANPDLPSFIYALHASYALAKNSSQHQVVTVSYQPIIKKFEDNPELFFDEICKMHPLHQLEIFNSSDKGLWCSLLSTCQQKFKEKYDAHHADLLQRNKAYCKSDQELRKIASDIAFAELIYSRRCRALAGYVSDVRVTRAEERLAAWHHGIIATEDFAMKFELYTHHYLTFLKTIDIDKLYAALKLLPREHQFHIFTELRKICIRPHRPYRELCRPIPLHFSRTPHVEFSEKLHIMVAYAAEIDYRTLKLLTTGKKDDNEFTASDWTNLGRLQLSHKKEAKTAVSLYKALCLDPTIEYANTTLASILRLHSISSLTIAEKIWALRTSLANHYDADTLQCLEQLKSQQRDAAAQAAKLAAAEEKKRKAGIIRKYGMEEAAQLASLLTSFLELQNNTEVSFSWLLNLQNKAVLVRAISLLDNNLKMMVYSRFKLYESNIPLPNSFPHDKPIFLLVTSFGGLPSGMWGELPTLPSELTLDMDVCLMPEVANADGRLVPQHVHIASMYCRYGLYNKALAAYSSAIKDNMAGMTIFPSAIAAAFAEIASVPDLARCTEAASPQTLSEVFQQAISLMCRQPRDTDFYTTFTTRLLTIKKDHVFEALKLLPVQLQLELYKDICTEPASYDAREFLNPFRILFWRKTGMADCKLTSGTLKKINAYYKELSAPAVRQQAAGRLGVFGSIVDTAIYSDDENPNDKEKAIKKHLKDRAEVESTIHGL